MRIGLVMELNGTPSGGERPVSRWPELLRQVQAAEEVGFDIVVFEDDLLLEYGGEPRASWESVAIAGAVAVSTRRIEFGHSVINMPYRPPAMLVRTALTLDEISGGRYSFGIGAGNTPDSDYEAHGVPKDLRFSRFDEAIQIIHPLLKEGRVDFSGTHHSVANSRTILDRVRPSGPELVIAAGGPKMMRLAARYADAWNWWSTSPTGDLPSKVSAMDAACVEEGRDPASLRRTVDLYTFDPLGAWAGDPEGAPAFGSTLEQMTGHIEAVAALGFDEVRCHLHAPPGVDRADPVRAMADVVAVVHR